MKKLLLISLFFSSYSLALTDELEKYIPEKNYGDQIVDKRYFVVSYSNFHEQPEWAYYKLDSKMLSGDAKRINYFRKDHEIQDETPSMNDYKNSGYDRGHLVPAADMKLNRHTMRSTFVMSNVVPQKPSFNRFTWKILESKVREFAHQKGSVFVITGPVLEDGLKRFSSQKISVPTMFYKIVFRVMDGKIETISFLVPHSATNKNIGEYVTSIDKIEALTGVDFFKKLPDSLEKEIESKTLTGKWSLNSREN